MRKEHSEFMHKHKTSEAHRKAYDTPTKHEGKKKANKMVKHLNKLNVFESPKHEMNRKKERQEAAKHMEIHKR